MEAGGDGHEALVAALRRAGVAPDRVIDAFARVPRHVFLPGADPAEVYVDDAVVTHREDGAGTGFNAALLAELAGPEGAVTAVELQPSVAEAAAANLRAAGLERVEV